MNEENTLVDSKLKKIVYEDDGKTKVIKGYILSEDLYLIKIKAEKTNEIMHLGKRTIIKIAWKLDD